MAGLPAVLRLMRGYASRQDRTLGEGVLAAAMTWAEPLRDVALPRSLALRQLAEGRILRCVWSGKRLDAGTVDIDHCLPWAAWPRSDLWSLMPAHRCVNREREQLSRSSKPSSRRLDATR